ncbi:unnamed protein product [Haemonchus placei]|uniref:Protein DPCD n=1 Tax=Haemonchus placei TaxID=6290 RepID=A0A0N4WIL2_HAEPC|nr:unnamed protein product [Haemonchus placei]
MNHVDVDQLLEDYAWGHFKDIQSLRRTRLDDFKSLERDDCEFIINRKNLMWINEDPQYTEFVPVGAKPYTLFKSVYTNNTNRPQEYSFKTERTTESLCSISREQGYSMGAEAELTLKTPCRFFPIWDNDDEMNFPLLLIQSTPIPRNVAERVTNSPLFVGSGTLNYWQHREM